jgi:hypothetical protein
MTKFRKEGLAAELRSFSRLTVRLEYANMRNDQRNRTLFSLFGFGTPIARLLSRRTVAGLCTDREIALLREPQR